MELSPQDAQQLTTQVADLARAGLPLAAGLRAAAEEARSASLAAGMRHLAAELEKGKSLEESLASCEGELPPHLRGLVRAGIRSGGLGRILAELVDHQAATEDATYRIYAALMYPVTLAIVTAGLLVIACMVLVPIYRPVMTEFDTELPWVTNSLFWVADIGIPLGFGCGAALIVVAFVVRIVGGAANWQWLMSTVPVFGALWLDAATSELSRLLSLLVEQRVPLPESLRLAAEAISDANVAEACRAAAGNVERGEPLSQALASSRRLPASLIPILEWGERTSALPAALESADEMFLGRVKLRATFIASVMPPLILVVVVALVGFIVGALLTPLISLITNLSR